jgi:hypothetical protein
VTDNEQCFPCSSFRKLPEIFGVFVGEAVFKSDRPEFVDATAVHYGFSHGKPPQTQMLIFAIALLALARTIDFQA